jgi:predicted RNA-binding protein with RPS1 domain
MEEKDEYGRKTIQGSSNGQDKTSAKRRFEEFRSNKRQSVTDSERRDHDSSASNNRHDTRRRFEEFRDRRDRDNRYDHHPRRDYERYDAEDSATNRSRERYERRDYRNGEHYGGSDRYYNGDDRNRRHYEHRRSRSRDRDYRRDHRSPDRYDNEHERMDLKRGDIVTGVVSRLESYGAFIDIQSILNDKQRKSKEGPINIPAMVHVSQISNEGRIDKPADVLTIGQTVIGVVLEVYEERGRSKVSVSIRGVDPATQELRNDWSMPPPRHAGTDHRNDEFNGKSGAELYAEYSSTKHLSGKNKQEYLMNRAVERAKMREIQDEGNSWRGRDIVNNNAASIARLVWGRSPSPVVDKKKRSPSVSSDSSDSSSSTSSSSSETSTSSSEYSRRRHRRKRSSRHSNDRSRRRKQNSGKRRRKRSYSSSSSVSSSSSDSSSSGSSSSSSDSDREGSVKSKKENPITEPIENYDKTESYPSKLSNNDADEDDLREAREFKIAVQGNKQHEEDSDDDMGPKPIMNQDTGGGGGGSTNASKSYGKALLPGEGDAIAAFVQQNLRIPRRGEIGYGADEIENYEKSGYVMSGSRHARMNAVRIRKENQVYSAEEQRALALITLEEKAQKEAALVNDFRTMLKEKRDKITKGK